MDGFIYEILNGLISNINPLQPGVASLYPLKTSGFLMFSGGREKQHRAVMG